MKILIRKLFKWIFKEELQELYSSIKEYEKIYSIIGKMEISIDVHQDPLRYSKSWAVISIQGKRDYIKFINLGDSDLREIQRILNHFEKSKIDATPESTIFLKCHNKIDRKY